jgi:chromosome segregation ATPase
LPSRHVNMSEPKKILNWRFIFLLGIAVLLFVIFLRVPKPCQEPLTYRIGRVDEKFGLTRSEFSLAVRKAAAIWEQPLSRELFREDPQGKIEINLIYDYRQKTSDKLKQINSRMDDTKDTYENMKTRYESLKSEYEQKRIALENDFNSYNARINAYNAEIETWNRQGGAPETHRSRLMSEKNELNSVRESLKIRQDEVNSLADEVNSMALVTNEIAARQNLDVEQYRDVGSRLGGEFQEGFFESKEGKQSITIHHFDNEAKLIRLLIHELGHALRLKHSSNPKAVMYRLNQFDTAELTEDDIAALRARCEGK